MDSGTARKVRMKARRLPLPTRKATITSARAIDTPSTGASTRRISGVARRRRFSSTPVVASKSSAPTARMAVLSASASSGLSCTNSTLRGQSAWHSTEGPAMGICGENIAAGNHSVSTARAAVTTRPRSKRLASRPLGKASMIHISSTSATGRVARPRVNSSGSDVACSASSTYITASANSNAPSGRSG